MSNPELLVILIAERSALTTTSESTGITSSTPVPLDSTNLTEPPGFDRFSDEGAQGTSPQHEKRADLTGRKTSSLIYISTDTDPACPQRILQNVPWLRMTFHDNSDFAPMLRMGDTGKEVEMEEVSRGEEFVQAGVSPAL